ncbi:MAG: ThiF family adenylyltransferase [Candidatus Cloacimonetes bacterium]|nr:ThiF family adenylyltransferase [Candidatus Cloacimonadota bacterium]
MHKNLMIVPSVLNRAQRLLDSIQQCRVLADWHFVSELQQWCLELELRREIRSDYISEKTNWFVLVDSGYPFGEIEFYPAVEGGIQATFPHQIRNDYKEKKSRWREGKLCLDTPYRDSVFTIDPVGNVEERLFWYVNRALEWLKKAANNTLLADGEPFELPWVTKNRLSDKFYFVHDESPETFCNWQEYFGCWGRLKFSDLEQLPQAIVIDHFLTVDNKMVRRWNGRQTKLIHKKLEGFWYLAEKPVIQPPWKHPENWGELSRAISPNRDSFLECKEYIRKKLEGSKEIGIFLIGYPIPKYVGKENIEIAWYTIQLPRISSSIKDIPNGFRNNLLGRRMRAELGCFKEDAKVSYISTKNWSKNRLNSRGRIEKKLADLNIGLVGVGALGSMLAELLARLGIKKMLLLDSDVLDSGNTCRHTATLNDIGEHKVKTVHNRLLQISPHLQVLTNSDGLSGEAKAMAEILEPVDMIVDCTGSDEVIQLLSLNWWAIPKRIVSLSLGYKAQSLLVYGSYCNQFVAEDYFKWVEGPKRADEEKWENDGEVLEGSGCWSPLFPARYDDIVIAAGLCVKELERIADLDLGVNRALVYQLTQCAEAK